MTPEKRLLDTRRQDQSGLTQKERVGTMPDDRINEVSMRFLGQPRRWGCTVARGPGWEKVGPVVRHQRSFLPDRAFRPVGTSFCRGTFTAPAVGSDFAPPRPWSARWGDQVSRDRAVRPGLWLAWCCSGRLGTGGRRALPNWRSTQPRIRYMWPTATTTTAQFQAVTPSRSSIPATAMPTTSRAVVGHGRRLPSATDRARSPSTRPRTRST